MTEYSAEWLFGKELGKQIAEEKIKRINEQLEELHRKKTVLQVQLELCTRDIERYYKDIRKDP